MQGREGNERGGGRSSDRQSNNDETFAETPSFAEANGDPSYHEDRSSALYRRDADCIMLGELIQVDLEERSMQCRGVRGATTVESDTRDEILNATRQLIALMIRLNEIESCDVASAIFSTTRDLHAEFPALAARQLGWLDVPLLCTNEMEVPGALPRCIRVLINWNTNRPQSEITHVYVKEAVKLRPDLSDLPAVDEDELEEWISEQMASMKLQRGS